jgi:hypothetical protein
MEAWRDGGMVASTAITAGIVADPKRAQALAVVNGVITNVAFLGATRDRPLPCTVVINLKNRAHVESGLMVVEVYAYGRAQRAKLRCISRFNLRVASDVSTINHWMDLRYGRILNSEGIDLSVAKICLKHCQKNHGLACSAPSWSRRLVKPSDIDFQVVDVVQERLAEMPNAEACNYVCLSYVWGKYRTVTLDAHRLDEFKQPRGLSPSRPGVAKTIRDAMNVTKKLRMRYLWVDSLCIIQGKSKDRDEQIKQMDRIYGSAVLTIVAADGTSADAGLLGVPGSRTVDQLAEEVRAGINVLAPVQKKLDLRTWESRAWTLQEKLLSKRPLVFSNGHMNFHCLSCVAHEDMTAKDAGFEGSAIRWLSLIEDEMTSVLSRIKTDVDGSTRLLRSPFFGQYADLIEQYTHRQMTVPDDALRAIQGLKILERSRVLNPVSSPASADQTPYGLPEESIDLTVLWQPAPGIDVRLRRRTMSAGEEIPSWSWAAWEGIHDEGSKGGVRYERPHKVLTDMTGAHNKVIPSEEEAEERVRPVVRWFQYVKLKPVPPPKPPCSPKPSALGSSGRTPGRLSVGAPDATPLSPSSRSPARARSPAKQLTAINGGTGLGLVIDGELPD